MNDKRKKSHRESLEEFDEQLERLCEKYIRKGVLRPIDIIGRLEFWKTEYMSDLFCVDSDIRNLQADIQRMDATLHQLEERLP